MALETFKPSSCVVSPRSDYEFFTGDGDGFPFLFPKGVVDHVLAIGMLSHFRIHFLPDNGMVTHHD